MIAADRIANLLAAINAYLAEHNASPKPFVWTKFANAILAKLDHCPVPSVLSSALVWDQVLLRSRA